jgi:hypothetical protein
MRASNGTLCGVNKVCNAGACISCAQNSSCTPTNECHVGSVDCSTGVSVCTDTGKAVVDATSCGNGNACMGGMCMNNCTSLQPNTVAGVFVAPGGGSGACGSETQPCGTIALGLAAIATSAGTKTILYLANGTYTEQVILPAGITIQGGWLDTGGTWTHLCGSPEAGAEAGAVIQAPAGTATTIVASYSGTSTLDTVTVQSIPTAAGGQSLYGIMATGAGTSLVLSNVDINVAAGGAGDTGSTGSAGAAGASGACSATSDGLSGSNGTPGAGAVAGTFAAGGFTPNSGMAGVTSGTDGHNGGQPAAAVCNTVENDCVFDCSGCSVDTAYSCCNTAGSCGNGGTGSGPGGPGSGGGSSIGVYVWAATVTVTGGAITTLGGGNGGDGGPGGTPGTGTLGPSGAPGKIPSSCSNSCHLVAGEPVCTCKAGTLLTTCAAAGPGTRGGDGGQGGQGGGGSGGFSYCWYQGGGGMVTASTSAMCTPGPAGSGGSQNAGTSQGANGAAGMHN